MYLILKIMIKRGDISLSPSFYLLYIGYTINDVNKQEFHNRMCYPGYQGIE